MQALEEGMENLAEDDGPGYFNPPLQEMLHRVDTQLITSFKQAPESDSVLNEFLDKVSINMSSGASSIADSLGSTANDVASFFKNLSLGQSTASSGSPLEPNFAATSMFSSSITDPDQSFSDVKDPDDVEGVYGVDYSKYPIGSYVKLPAALQPFVNLPGLDHYLVISKPTMDKSGGLEGYREAVPKSRRAAAPFLIIVDEPGKTIKDKGYLWYEFKLVDVFKLDVSGMKSFDDYLNKLSKKARWNCKDRQKKLASSPLRVEYVPLPQGSRELLDTMWPLYKQTGDKNGFCVLGEQEFYDFHLNTADLTVMMIKDTSKADQLVTFCTGVRSKDVLMPMWCGTDYDHELAMKCSTYFNMLYEYFRLAIADPEINWVDLGATRRQAKTGIGCDGYPVSGYVRCKNSVMLAIVETMMKEYFHPDELMNDP